ncbi:two-component regulator propeller domain-containing protein [Cytophagaceae bacterium YF14B1]|uniref:histidine kinase n=1 Tax=Xanthocytophaga flava TaxID=3048013 RepID=A0AAE3UAF1_9BACT|nr:two-component regulator propeller domain-containing protein [Xanthocytophaga flavus]MDJ1482734.1 two-component regulator propeller domain-containing protein [Xanthocytophaga flavus]
MRTIGFLWQTTLPVLTLVMFILWTAPSEGQSVSTHPISFEHLGTSQGISQSTVHAIHQDQEGFIWIATRDGLNRYDGRSFQSYHRQPRKPGSLQSSDITALGGGKDGQLWLGTINGGLHRLNADGKTFTHYGKTSSGVDVSHWSINCLAEDDRQRVWAGTTDYGWLVVDTRTGQVSQYRLDTSSVGNASVLSVLTDKDHSLWFGMGNGILAHLPKGQNQWEVFRMPAELHSRADFNIKALLRDYRGNLWIGTKNRGLYRFIEGSGQFIKVFDEPGVFEKGNFIRCLAEDTQHSIWAGTDDGIRILPNGDPTNWIGLHPDPVDEHSLSSHAIQCLLTDQSGNMWAGTWEGGLNVRYAEPNRFEIIKPNPAGTRRLLAPKVSALTTDLQGDLWVGSVRGILRLSGKTQSRVTISAPSAFNTQDVYTLFTDYQGDVYASYWNGGVVRHKRDGTSTVIPVSEQTARHVLCFAQRGNGKVWMVRNDLKLYVYDPLTEKLEQAVNLFNLFKLKQNMTITCLLEDKQGWLWFGTYTYGLVGWHPQTGQIIHYQAKAKAGSLSDDHITCLYQDKSGKLWMGTNGGGLNCLLSANGKFRLLTSQQGLSGDVVNSITEDQLGNLWIGTTRGLTRLTIENEHMVVFNEEDGLPSAEFTNLACTRMPTGEVAFGTSQGLLIVHPERFSEIPSPPKAYLDELKLFNRPVGIGTAGDPLQKALSKTSHLVLNPQQSVFTLTFGALSYGRNRHVRFAYRLDNFDPDWNYLDNQENATYTNLPPGQYVFRLKAAQSGQPWGPEKRLEVIVQPPWFKTGWAVALYLAILLVILGLIRQIVRIREKLKADIRIQELKADSIRQLEQVRTSFFTNVSHELRTPLTLIITPLEKLLTEELPSPERLQHQFRLMNRHANRLLRLISQLLDLSKIESGSLRPQISQGNLYQHLENSIRSFEQLAESKQVQLKLQIDPTLRQAWYDADITEKIIFNLLSNALKYVPEGGLVSVEAAICENKLQLVVSDTGAGIAPDELPRIFERFYQGKASNPLGTGVGLALTRELTELLGGTIFAFSTQGIGSQFVVTLPIVSTDFPSEWIASLPDEPPNQATQQLTPSAENFTGGSPKSILLIAEDDPDLRSYLADCFTDSYIVLQASDGQQALDLTLQHLPDLVITDWMMPGMEGPELCQYLKADEKTSHIPLVLLTARSSQSHQLSGVNAGADDYITKPFTAALLKSRVHNLIENRQRLRRAFSQEVWLRPSNVKVTSLDEVFLQRATALIEEHIDEPNFDAEQLQEGLNMSQMQLYRKLKSLTDLSARDFIRYIRIQRAAQLLKESQFTVSEVAYQVGFNDPGYFSRCFKKQFGKTPNEYASEKV